MVDKMKQLKYMLAVTAALVMCACGKDDEMPRVTPEGSGTFTDTRDGEVYAWVKFAGLDWMTSNMKAATAQGKYDLYKRGVAWGAESLNMHARYGYLYDHAAASAACPQGWRLPGDDDWQKLEQALGMGASQAAQTGWRGSFEGELMQQREEGTGLGLEAAGFINFLGDGNKTLYEEFGVSGLYWSATDDDTRAGATNAFYRKIMFNSKRVYRYSAVKTVMMSVRCVRDSQ